MDEVLLTQQLTIGSGAVTIFGCGAIDRLPTIVPRPAQDRAFVVTDRGVAAAGIAGRVERILAAAGIATATFDEVRPNPSTDDLDAGAQSIRAFSGELVVAVGGGSVLDVAKGIALMAVNDGSARDFDYRNQPASPGLPIVAV